MYFHVFNFRMATKSYQAGFKRCYGGRLSNLSHKTTENEIQQIYDDWAKEYEKVITELVHVYNISFQTN